MSEARVRKAFSYAVRSGDRGHELLAFASHEEPGFEVPKGAAEPGETFENAARRELREESGLDVGAGVNLGTTWYQNEEQQFFLFALPQGVPDRFRHVVTGHGGDAGLAYEFRFLPLDETLAARLVQGSGALVEEIRRRLGSASG